MKLNVPRFRNLAKKATLNYTIEKLQLNIDPKEIKAAMISGPKDVLTNVCVENDCILNMGPEDRITLNFSDPAGKLNRYLDVIQGDETEILSIEEGTSITLNAPGIQGEKNVSVINMVAESVIRPFVSQKSAKEMKYFISLDANETFHNLFETHKKIAPFHQKIYFGVKDKKFFIMSGDLTNPCDDKLHNGICDIDHEDLTMCFEFRNVLNMMSIISESRKPFSLNFTYSKNEDRGLVHAASNDGCEKYFLISRNL